MSNEGLGGEAISILTCDDYFLIREGLKAVLGRQPDMKIVGEVETAEEAIRLVDDLLPDVVIMDILLPGMNGMEATRIIKRNHPSVAVVALTRYTDTESIMEIYRSGAAAYLAKSVKAQELVTTVRAVYNGGVMLHAHIANAVIQSFNKSTDVGLDAARAALSSREMAVLQLVARGRSNKEIAQELSISVRTAQNHIANIFRKLELNDRVSAAVYAIKQGLAKPAEGSPPPSANRHAE